MKLSQLKSHPNNPKGITPEELDKLKDSIDNFPKMMTLRPLIIDENNIVLAGNQKLKALKALDFKEIPKDWVKKIDNLTEDEKKEFLIRDNVTNGHWIYADFEDEYWQGTDYEDWLGEEGFTGNIDAFFEEQEDNGDKQKNRIVLDFTEEDYAKIKEKLDSMEGSKEKIIFELVMNAE